MSEFKKSTYANFHKGASNEEVLAIFEDENMYVDEARLAAYTTLKGRGFEFSSSQSQEAEILQQQAREQQKETLAQKQKQNELDEVRPLWYSPSAIIGFSVFFSVFFGAILLAMNFYQSQKKNKAFLVVGVGVLFSIIAAVLTQFTQVNQWVLLIINVVGALVLLEFFWKKQLGLTTPYKRRSIWPALGIAVAISVGLFFLLVQINPELLAQLQNKV